MEEKNNEPTTDGNKNDLIKGLEEELTEINPNVFSGLDPDQKKKILTSTLIAISHEKMHSGPIPDPETLERYNDIIPNGADRIMRMAEKQQDHRMDIEKRVIRSNNIQSYFGQAFGFIIGLSGIAAGVYLVLNGQKASGATISGVTLVALVSVFVIGKRQQKRKK